MSVASHYYHYAVWIAVALVLGTLAVRILTGGDDISTGAITVVVAPGRGSLSRACRLPRLAARIVRWINMLL